MRTRRDRGRVRVGALAGLMAGMLATGTIGSPALAQHPSEEPIVGTWQATLDAAGDTARAGLLFTADGGVVVTSPDGLDGAALGRWERVDDGYHVTVVAYVVGQDGTLLLDLVATVGEEGTLSATGTAMLPRDDGKPETRALSATATRLLDGGVPVDRPTATVITAAGAGPDPIAEAVAEYKALLGSDNGGEPGSRPDGFRTITWDRVPAQQSAPNTYDPDFFNGPAAPRARGAEFDAPAGALMVSAGADDGSGMPPRFGNLNSQYPDQFQAFSPEKLFSPVSANVVDLVFFVHGSDTPAVVRGFGAVYTDVDTEHTAFEYFDAAGRSLGSFATPVADGGLSFLGVAFPEPVIRWVRITYGTAPPGAADAPGNDVAVMDDFIYGEPQPLD